MKSVFDWREDKPALEVKQPAHAVKVRQMDMQGKEIAIFPSMKDAARRTRIDYRRIHNVVSGARKSTGGFVFEACHE